LAKAKKITLSHQLVIVTTMRGAGSDIGSNWFLRVILNFSRITRCCPEGDARLTLNGRCKYLTDSNLTSYLVKSKGALAAKPKVRRSPLRPTFRNSSYQMVAPSGREDRGCHW
jgi:hypothetical protein